MPHDCLTLALHYLLFQGSVLAGYTLVALVLVELRTSPSSAASRRWSWVLDYGFIIVHSAFWLYGVVWRWGLWHYSPLGAVLIGQGIIVLAFAGLWKLRQQPVVWPWVLPDGGAMYAWYLLGVLTFWGQRYLFPCAGGVPDAPLVSILNELVVIAHLGGIAALLMAQRGGLLARVMGSSGVICLLGFSVRGRTWIPLDVAWVVGGCLMGCLGHLLDRRLCR